LANQVENVSPPFFESNLCNSDTKPDCVEMTVRTEPTENSIPMQHKTFVTPSSEIVTIPCYSFLTLLQANTYFSQPKGIVEILSDSFVPVLMVVRSTVSPQLGKLHICVANMNSEVSNPLDSQLKGFIIALTDFHVLDTEKVQLQSVLLAKGKLFAKSDEGLRQAIGVEHVISIADIPSEIAQLERICAIDLPCSPFATLIGPIFKKDKVRLSYLKYL